MRKFSLSLLVFALLSLSLWVLAQNKNASKSPDASGDAHAHVLVTPDKVVWGPAPPSLPAGAEMAVLQGDPSKAGAPFTLRAKFPNGYRVPPHWHPTDENVVVIQGTMVVGLGEKFDESAGRELPAGSYSLMPKGQRHFAWAKEDTIIQVYGTGPFEINYVNAADDPRRKTTN